MSEAACILVVDDDREVREALKLILEGEGYDVVSATNGLEALERLDEGCRPCLILLDLLMPLVDGWQFLAERSKTPELAAIPVIVITAADEIRVSRRRTSILRKPFALEDLLLRIGESRWPYLAFV
jgi:CheY-like chemotaxis protein